MMKASAFTSFLFFSAADTSGFATIHAEIARPCADDTKLADKLVLTTVDGLAALTGPAVCIDAATRMEMPASAVEIRKNRFGTFSVELLLTPQGRDHWEALQRAAMHEPFILFDGHRAVIYIRIVSPQNDGKLTLFASSQEEAELIGNSLRGD